MPRIDWKTRCEDAGLTMPTLARLTNRGMATLAKQVELGAISHPVIATILAYEMMLPWQRKKWLERVEQVTDGGWGPQPDRARYSCRAVPVAPVIPRE